MSAAFFTIARAAAPRLAGACCAFLLLAMAAHAHATTTSLDAGWQFHRDETHRLVSAGQVPPGAWSAVDLPHAARIEARVPQDPWQGTVFYKKRFDVTLRPGERAILRFEGVMNVADVWLNGRHLGQHLGGYLPFAFDITDALEAAGGNELVVRANNDDNPVTGPKPLKQLDYIQHGGIYRSVRLTVKPPVHITDEMLSATPAGGGVFVTYPQADAARATVRVQTEIANTSSAAQQATVRHTLSLQGRPVARIEQPVRLTAGERRHVTVPIALAKPRLWSPTAPNLYTLETTIVAAGRKTPSPPALAYAAWHSRAAGYCSMARRCSCAASTGTRSIPGSATPSGRTPMRVTPC